MISREHICSKVGIKRVKGLQVFTFLVGFSTQKSEWIQMPNVFVNLKTSSIVSIFVSTVDK